MVFGFDDASEFLPKRKIIPNTVYVGVPTRPSAVHKKQPIL